MRKHHRLRSLGTLAAVFTALLDTVHTLSFTPVTAPDLDLSNLGRVAVVGDFDSISVYQYKEQTQNSYNTNGSQAILGRFPDGSFGVAAASDGNIEAMCPFIMRDGSLAGIVVGGNFTSLGGVQASGIALFNPNTSAITPLPGISGRVSSIYCDASSATVYVGGAFTGANSTNAIAWVTGWTNLPFAGFNGPVNSITKAPNGNIVFGGEFDGLGNATTPLERNSQAINIGSADVTASGTTTTAGYENPQSIVCKDFTKQGSGLTWLLEDNASGFWNAKFGFGFNPTLLRLYNTNYQGRGAKTFRMTALPINGIMNLTYTDSTGQQKYCDALCPLPEGNLTAQDFTLVNPIGMNEVRIDISAWYGSGGGLNGIQLLQDDLYTFAVADFNEPQCSAGTTGANATKSGAWFQTPSGTSSSDYLTATLNSSSTVASTVNVVFQPDIKQSGNYSITMYTPGCVGDGTCSSRGTVNVTGQVSSKGSLVSTTVAQSNDFDKYDQIFFGYVDVTTSGFRPQITLAPMANQQTPLTVVAQRIRFELVNSTGGLNGLFEYNPNLATVDLDFTDSVIDTAATSVGSGAIVNALAVVDQTLYVAGAFTSSGGALTGVNNILSVGSANATSLPSSGLNSAIATIYQTGSSLYIGGNFTSTGDNSVTGLNGVALFSTTDNTWHALGAGVNGSVDSIVYLQVNNSAGHALDTVAVSGQFSTVNAFGQNASFSANNIAIWVPASSNWLSNIDTSALSFNGHLVAETSVPNQSPLYAGSVTSQLMGRSGGVGLTGKAPTLLPLGITIASSAATLTSSTTNLSASTAGVVTGLFLQQNSINVTVLGGHFSTKTANNTVINNLAIINGQTSGQITGLPSGIATNSTILSMDTKDSTLFIGGQVAGTTGSNTVNGFLVYDLAAGALLATQPPALNGASVTVKSVVVQPNTASVYVGGNFTQAGSLNCPALCVWDFSTGQWVVPGTGLSGVVNAMTWASATRLIMAGNLTVGGNATSIVTYDSKAQTFSAFSGASALPGPVSAMTPATSDYSQLWVTGIAKNNGSSFVQKYDGSNWIPVAGLGEGSQIRSVQMMSVTSDHAASSLVDKAKVLFMAGSLVLPGYGNASAVLFNGTTYQPLLLTGTANNVQGSVSRMFVQNPGNFLSGSGGGLARGFIVLIALAIALALIFLLVVAGLLMERRRRQREGYAPIKQLSPDQQGNLGRIPPERLFGTLNEKSPAPKL